MAGYQRFVFMGNVTKDPEIKRIGENEVCKFSVAVNGYKDSVEFFDAEWWKPNAAAGYLAKGVAVLCEGELQTQKWEKDGQPRSKVVVRVSRLTLCGGKQQREPEREPEFAADFA
jgi:single stranded DNA-binding protein